MLYRCPHSSQCWSVRLLNCYTPHPQSLVSSIRPLHCACLRASLPLSAVCATYPCNLASFQPNLKSARSTVAKKPTLDPDTCSSYRPISNLSFISKLIERVVVRRLSAHVSESNLFPYQQSAYRPFHSTEIVVLSVHDTLVRFVSDRPHNDCRYAKKSRFEFAESI